MNDPGTGSVEQRDGLAQDDKADDGVAVGASLPDMEVDSAAGSQARPDTPAGGEPGEGPPRGTARGSVTVAAWTLISRIAGLLRVVVIGAVLGPTFFANAFLSANTVPNLIYGALAGPVLALVLA